MDKKKEEKNKKPAESAPDVQDAEILTEEHASEDASAQTARIAELESELSEAISTAQRLQAEFDNYRKRNAKLRVEALDEGTEIAVKALLDTLDNFDRAMENKPADSTDPFVQGMALVYKQMTDALHKLGLNEIEADGQFDPVFHDAVMQDDSGEFESGTVTAVLQKGYKLNERVIRHAMVKVAK